MQEERRMILRMLEEGKITAEEAEALLNALGDAPGGSEEEPQEDPWVHLGKMGDDIASKVEAAAERFSRSLERTVREKFTKLPEFLAKFPFGGSEETQEFTQVVRGPVGPGEVLPVDLSNVNGSIRLQGWSEDYYQLTVVQRVKGSDRELLRSRLFAVDWEDDAVRDDFRLSVPGFEDRSISLHLLVPETRTYEVKLVSKNGSLGVENLRGTTVHVKTANGSTELRSLQAGQIQGWADNGSCEMERVKAEKISHELHNGSYRLSMSAPAVDLVTTNGSMKVKLLNVHGSARYRLRTTNGSVKVNLPEQADLGVALDLESSVGRVSAEVDSLEVSQDERRGVGAVFKAHSSGFQNCRNQLHLAASCVSGSITVSTAQS